MKRQLKFRVWYGKEFVYFSLGETNRYPSNVTDWPVYQFTGLLDRHGKEIYDGDLLVMNLEKNFKKYHSDPFVMQWNPETAAWTNYSPREIVEVIGNIHEHIHLLQ